MNVETKLSKTQTEVFEKLSRLAHLQFTGTHAQGPLNPRIFPLIAGPTGAGKSFLVRRIAASISADYQQVTFGNWMPMGINDRQGIPTTYSILDRLREHQWLVFHVDELDKLELEFGQQWSRSIANDLWNVLDYRLPLTEWAQSRSVRPDEAEHLALTLRDRLWIVGSGTWQKVFETPDDTLSRSPVGFARSPATPDTQHDLQARILAQRLIPTELTARFHSELLILHYPRTLQEIQDLLDTTGVSELAARTGTPIDPASISFKEQGMRVIESLYCDLLLQQQDHILRSNPALSNSTNPALDALRSLATQSQDSDDLSNAL